MQSHKGLPKNIPKNKVKPKIFSSSSKSNKGTPLKSQGSPENSIYRSSPSKTPQKSTSSLSKSQHRLNSKQKPIKPLSGRKQNQQRMNQTMYVQKFDESINLGAQKTNHWSQKPKSNQFLESILGMMGPLASNGKSNQKLLTTIPTNPQENQTNTNKISSIQPKNNQTPIYSLKHLLDSQIQPPPETIDQQLLNKCSSMLKDRKNWSSYNGELINSKKTGYGILYFKNKDKYMGGFKDDKAYGHGTYYDYESRRRIMGIWQQNQLVFSNQIIVQKF